MNMKTQLSIIIPCKNEEAYIGKLLTALTHQELESSTEIIIADANSNDSTRGIINQYKEKLPNLQVVEGGLPAVGRNIGARIAKGDILLFIDADCYFKDNKIIKSSVNLLLKSKLDLIGCLLNIESNFKVRFVYFLCNLIFRLSRYDKPFVVGSYLMIKKETFFKNGGFDESLMHCEDYFLSKKVESKKFNLINKYVYTDDRRFKKMTTLGIIRYFIKNIIFRNNENYFKKDIGYWK